MSGLEIERIAAFNDNYIWLLHAADGKATAVIDPGDAGVVRAALDRNGWTLTHILVTHHHADHTGGVAELKAATGCTVVGWREDAARVPGIDMALAEGDELTIGSHPARLIAVPGHTSGHVAYHFFDDCALFCGDALFSLGCGRIFEGTPGQMWESLLKLRALPDETRVFCAHEYTNSNADFALSIDPDNAELQKRADAIIRLRETGKSTVPSSLGEEKRINPFLRADDP
ncbi:MAG: hydroxyacylglutathione hydrolase, partial [Rhodospirillales bacterium]|nr:hydroxyacylglutathione hydrolase [Rhodospirillales bacterium]